MITSGLNIKKEDGFKSHNKTFVMKLIIFNTFYMFIMYLDNSLRKATGYRLDDQ